MNIFEQNHQGVRRFSWEDVWQALKNDPVYGQTPLINQLIDEGCKNAGVGIDFYVDGQKNMIAPVPEKGDFDQLINIDIEKESCGFVALKALDEEKLYSGSHIPWQVKLLHLWCAMGLAFQHYNDLGNAYVKLGKDFESYSKRTKDIFFTESDFALFLSSQELPLPEHLFPEKKSNTKNLLQYLPECEGHGAIFYTLEQVRNALKLLQEYSESEDKYKRVLSKNKSTPEQHNDDKIKKVQVSFENDAQFQIKFPGKSFRPCTYADLRYTSSINKDFNALLEIIQHGSVCLKKRSLQKRLERGCESLCDFIRREYNSSLPEDFKLWKRDCNIYSLIFDREEDISFDPLNSLGKLSKDDLVQKLKDLVEERTPHEIKTDEDFFEWRNKRNEKITNVYTVAQKKGATEQELNEILSPLKNEEWDDRVENDHDHLPYIERKNGFSVKNNP